MGPVTLGYSNMCSEELRVSNVVAVLDVTTTAASAENSQQSVRVCLRRGMLDIGYWKSVDD